MLRILLNGAAGRMGMVMQELLAKRQDAVLAGAVDACAPGDGILPALEAFGGEADCLVDFSHHAATEPMVDFAAGWKMPLVIATTGQTPEEMALIRQAAEQVPVFFSGNLSLGIAVLVRLAKITAAMFPDADIEIVEQHHNQKLDVPSGTALMLGRAIESVRPGSRLLVGRHEHGRRTKEEIGIHALRTGTTVGIHEVIIHAGSQVITLKHEALDRTLFAEGALAAAAFLQGKQPGLYDMNDIVMQP